MAIFSYSSSGRPEPLGQLGVGRGPAVLGLERLAGLLHLAVLGADQAGDPVHRPQLVEHGAADAGHAVGLELDAAAQVEGVDGVHQAEDPGRDQVVEVDPLGQALPDPLGVVLDQGQVALDEPVPQGRGGVFLELAPEFGHVHVQLGWHPCPP
jgi:hypothetical protein